MARHLFLGSIGVLAETSELQREAFNGAFEESGLDWRWSAEDYRAMLGASGGRKRIETYAAERGETVDAAEIHELKSAMFQARLDAGVPLRPGVAQAMAATRDQGGRIAMVSGTAPANVDAILDAVKLARGDFDLVTDASHGAAPKPAPDLYRLALQSLDLDPAEVLAVEDNPDGFAAARAAGLATLAFPGAFHAGAEFPGAVSVQSELDLSGASQAA